MIITASEARKKTKQARDANSVNPDTVAYNLDRIGDLIREAASMEQTEVYTEIPGKAMADALAIELKGLGFNAWVGSSVPYSRSNPPEVPSYYLHVLWGGADDE